MKYDEVIAAAFDPSPEGVEPKPTLDASPARRLRDALEPIAMHSVWSRQVNERLSGLGHDFMTGYVCCRAALMGTPDPGVVAAAFAVGAFVAPNSRVARSAAFFSGIGYCVVMTIR